MWLFCAVVFIATLIQRTRVYKNYCYNHTECGTVDDRSNVLPTNARWLRGLISRWQPWFHDEMPDTEFTAFQISHLSSHGIVLSLLRTISMTVIIGTNCIQIGYILTRQFIYNIVVEAVAENGRIWLAGAPVRPL